MAAAVAGTVCFRLLILSPCLHLRAQEVDSDDAEDISSDEEAPDLDDEGECMKTALQAPFVALLAVLYSAAGSARRLPPHQPGARQSGQVRRSCSMLFAAPVLSSRTGF